MHQTTYLLCRFTHNDQLLNKVVKDKEKKAAAQKKARAHIDKIKGDDEGVEDAPAADKQHDINEGKEAIKRQLKAVAGPPVFRQCLFPVEASLVSLSSLCLTLPVRMISLIKAFYDIQASTPSSR